jgi:cysteine synthase A
MQGWTPDFIPKLAEDVVDAHLIDEILPIKGNDALRLSRELARQEGIFTGISGGATFAGALEIAGRAKEGANILCMLPDTGERYLSTPLFEDISADMTAEEIEIAQSTPRYRFDVKAASQPAAASPEVNPVLDAESEAFVDEVLSDRQQPVVMFALEWCEFCWSVRKMFKACGIPYRSIDLDSAAYQENNKGGKIREVLKARIHAPTIPQIFIGGKHIGGCSETFDAFNAGELQQLLRDNNVPLKQTEGINAYSFLPSWLHPR